MANSLYNPEGEAEAKKLGIPRDAYYSMSKAELDRLRQDYEAKNNPPGFLENLWSGALNNLGAIGAGLAPVASSIIGNSATRENRDNADTAAQASLRLAGSATNQVAPSSLESYRNDPTFLAARQQALAGMQQRAQSGLTPEDLIEMRQAQQASDANLQAQQAKIGTDMSRRGLNLSPAQAMVQQQQAAQALGAQQAAESDRITQQSRAAQLAALQNVGTMGQSAMTQDFNQAQNVAQDRNVINQFNAQVLNASAQNQANAQERESARQRLIAGDKAANIQQIGQGVGGVIGTVAGAPKAPAPIVTAPKAPIAVADPVQNLTNYAMDYGKNWLDENNPFKKK